MTVLVSDSFNRANSTTTLGSTDSYNGGTATAWQALKGTWGISSNQGYCSSPSGNDNSAVVDVGISDVTITCTMADWGSSGGIIFRAVDMSNYYRLWRQSSTTLALQKFVSGTLTTLTTLSGQTFPLNDTVKFVLNGSTIQFYKSGTLAATVTDSSVMGTKHGLHHQYIDQYGLWDNFQIEDLSTGGTNATITSVVATANASSLAPTVNTQIQVSISSVVANATASTLVPSVSTDTSVSSIIANANASVIAPTMQAAQNISVNAPVSGVTASALIPSVGPLSVQITSVVASLTAIAIVPSVSIINTIIRTINLRESLSPSINLRGSLSSSINLNLSNSPSINLRGGI